MSKPSKMQDVKTEQTDAPKKASKWSLNAFYKVIYDKLKGNKGNLTLVTIAVLLLSEIPIYFFTLLDILKLKALFKYRLHYIKDQTEHLGIRNYPPWELIKSTFKVAEYNFFMAYVIPGSILIKLGDLLGIHVYDTEEGEDKVTWARFFKETFMISVLADVLFYGLHRLLHTPRFYKSYHKKHHEYKYSIALAHHYMEYKEALIFSLPQALPPIFLWALTGKKMHLTSMWAGVLFTQLNVILGHSGWQIPIIPKWLPSLQPDYHDYHHVDYKVNFGAIYPMTDWLFGTFFQPGVNKNLPTPTPGVKNYFDTFKPSS